MNKDLYLIPLILAWCILAIVLLLIKSKKHNKKIKMDRPFKKDIFNELYNFSFQAPFKYFLPEVEAYKKQTEPEKEKKGIFKFKIKPKKKKVNKEKEKKRLADEQKKIKDTEALLNKSGYNDKFNFRSFTVFKLLVFFCCIILYFILNIILANIDIVVKVLFNVSNEAKDKTNGDVGNQLGIVVFLLILCLIPQLYLKFKAINVTFKYVCKSDSICTFKNKYNVQRYI